MLQRLSQKAVETGSASVEWAFVTIRSPGREQAPNPMSLDRRNVETLYRSILEGEPQGKLWRCRNEMSEEAKAGL